MKSEAASLLSEIQQDSRPRWLSILGKTGNGKTFLAQQIFAVARSLAFRWIDGPGGVVMSPRQIRWVDWREACNRMRSGDFSDLQDLSVPARDQDYAVWLAVIDDIGAGSERDRAYLMNALDNIIDARLGQWTILTSNLNWKQMADLEGRVASRMLRGGNRIVEVNTVDYSLR